MRERGRITPPLFDRTAARASEVPALWNDRNIDSGMQLEDFGSFRGRHRSYDVKRKLSELVQPVSAPSVAVRGAKPALIT